MIAMFVFGLWHGGTILFMIWGIYHGLLLVAHRQWQEFRKRVGFEWSGFVPTMISWWITFSAVCIGYIFFNSHTLHQAFGMLKAIASPRRYRHITLDHSFCIMTLVAAIGYFAVIAGSMLLDRIAESAPEWTVSGGGVSALMRNGLQALATERWVWIAPIVIVLAIYFSVMFQPGHPDTGPVMYALF